MFIIIIFDDDRNSIAVFVSNVIIKNIFFDIKYNIYIYIYRIAGSDISDSLFL